MDKELKKQISEIDKELSKYKDTIKIVTDLKKKKTKLKAKLDDLVTAKLPFEKQFLKWLQSSKDHDNGDWIPSREEYPNLRTLMDSRDFNRYETVDVKDDNPFSGWWDCIVDENGKEMAIEEGWDYETILKAAKEVMENNLSYFKYDW